MKNQSLHGGFISPIQLDNFLFRAKPTSLPSSDVAQPARCTAPTENNIRLDAVFKKPSDIFLAQACRSRWTKGVVCQRRVLVEQHIIDYGSTSLLKSYSLNSVRIFRQAPAKSHGRILSMHPNQGAVLKAAGYFIKSIYYSHSLFLPIFKLFYLL